MHIVPTARQLADALPGDWKVRATNTLLWLNGQRIDPTITYGVASTAPLVLTGDVTFTTHEGKSKLVRGQSKWKRGEFVRRGRGIRTPFTRRWSVIGLNDAGTIAVLRHSKLGSQRNSLDVLAREEADGEQVRTIVAQHSERFGLSLEDFASLNWMLAPR